jgi:hypothetical protein
MPSRSLGQLQPHSCPPSLSQPCKESICRGFGIFRGLDQRRRALHVGGADREIRASQIYVPEKIFPGKVQNFACGWSSCLALMENGSLYVLGENGYRKSIPFPIRLMLAEKIVIFIIAQLQLES